MKYVSKLRAKSISLLSLAALTGSVLLPGIAHALAAGDINSWQTTTSLPTATVTAASAEYNGYEYILGGQGNNNAVYYGKFNSDGTISSWTTSTNPLPNTYGQIWRGTSVAYNGYIYYIGGFTGSAMDTVFYAPINPDGSVGTWTQDTGNPLPDYIESLTSFESNGYVYVIGGNEAGSIDVNTVYIAPLNPDGSVGTWVTSTNTLPLATNRLASAYYNGYVYVLGGNNASSSPTNAVYDAQVNSNGTLGAWATSTNVLPQALEQLTAEAYNGYLYAIGGDDAGTSSASVYYAPINADGSVGTWQTASNPLPQEASTSVSAAYNGYLYEFGGGTQDATAVYYTQIFVPPPPVTTTSSSNNKTPDTGFGAPIGSDNTMYIVTGAIVALAAGALLLYREKQTN